MRAAIYTRVSKEEGDLGRQQDETRAFAKARGWSVVAEESDKMSGASDKRPGLERVMKMARARKCDVIVVQALDRFARSIRHFVVSVAELEALGVAFVSTSQGFDMTTPMGKFTMTIFAAVAELERAMIRERIMSGLAKARREGKRLGRRPLMLSPLALRKYTAKKMPVRAIARKLGVSRTAVLTALKAL